MTRTVVFCAMLFVLLGICQSSLGPLVPVVRDQYGLTTATAGLLVSAFFVGSMASTLVGGALREKWVRPGLVITLITLMSIGLAGTAFAPAWPAKLIAVAVVGLGFGSLTLLVNTYLASRPGREGLMLVNLVNGAFGIGATVGPLLVGLTLGLGYRVLLTALAVAMLVSLPVRRVAQALQPATPNAAEPSPKVAPPGGSARLILFSLLIFCYAGLETGLSSWEAVFMRGEGFSLSEAASMTSLFWLGLAGARILARAAAVRWSAQRIVITSLTSSLGALALIGLPTTAPAGYLLAGFFAGPVLPSTLAWMAQTLPNPRRGNAIALASDMIGSIVLTAFIGLGIEVFSRRMLPVFVGIAVAAGLMTAWILCYRESRCGNVHVAAHNDPGS